jgi:hypothetical protein
MTDPLVDLHASVLQGLALSGLARMITWPDGSSELAIIASRTDPMMFDPRVSEPIWTARLRPNPQAARGTVIARDDGKRFALGERIGGTEYLDTWSLRPC